MPLVARTTKQDKVRELQRTLYRAAKADPGRRFHALYDKVLPQGRLGAARGSWCAPIVARPASTDRPSPTSSEYGIAKLLDELAADLKDGSYRSLPARRVFIPKPGRRTSEGRCRSRRSRHTPRSSNESLGSLVVTHPFHPLFGERLEVLYVRRFPTGRVYVCDGGGGRNVALDEEATDRGPEPAERPLSFEVLVEVAGVVAAVGGGKGKRTC